jgi:hypothetical protein
MPGMWVVIDVALIAGKKEFWVAADVAVEEVELRVVANWQ